MNQPTDTASCRHGCGHAVTIDVGSCPNCGGATPHPRNQPPRKPGLIERSCLIVMLLGGVLAVIVLILTKLSVG